LRTRSFNQGKPSLFPEYIEGNVLLCKAQRPSNWPINKGSSRINLRVS